jgi:ADP-heptose:LPS heptosyltransferase
MSRLDMAFFLFQKAGFSLSFAFPELFNAPSDISLPLNEKKDIVLVTQTSRRGFFKAWPLERWECFLEQLPEHEFLLIWGNETEHQTVKKLARRYSHVRVAKATDFAGLVQVFLHASVVVGTDTGPMHLAHLLNVPTLALFGPKSPKRYGPQYNKHDVIYHPQICSPCRNWRCDHKSCMWAISTGEVVKKMKYLMETNQ